MCLLTYFPEGILPDMKRLENGAVANPDGDGFAMIADGKIIVQKGLDSDRILESFEDLRKKHQAGPAMYHSRIGTAGSLSDFNCHPFRIGGDPRTVIAHNGILPYKAQPYKGDRRSDTHKLAAYYLPKFRFGAVHTKGGRKQLGKWAGAGNKFGILTVDPSITGNPAGSGYIVNESQGDWLDGVWYSNNSHDWNSTRYLRGAYGSGTSYYYPKSNHSVTYGDWWKDSLGQYHWTEGTADVTVDFTAASGDDDNADTRVGTDLLGSFDRGDGSPLDLARECPGCRSKGQWIEDLPSICGACWTCSACDGQVDECVCWLSPNESAEAHASRKANDYIQWWEENAPAASLAGTGSLWEVD